jgi:hypothetical protein
MLRRFIASTFHRFDAVFAALLDASVMVGWHFIPISTNS